MSGLLSPDDSVSPPSVIASRVEQGGGISITPRMFRVVELVLAFGWIAAPAIQYLGTIQRTGLQIEGAAASPQFATLDLTTLYLSLLAATLAAVAIRWLVQHDAPSVDEAPAEAAS